MAEQKVDIAQQIDKLIKIQEIDSVIYRLRAEKEQRPQQIQQLKQQSEQEKKVLEDNKNSIKQLQLGRKEKEIELETKESEVKKLNVQLYQLKSNKEYETMQNEIKGLQADGSVLEEDIIKLMDAVEEAEKGLTGEQKQLEQKQQEINVQIKRIEDEIKSIEDGLAKEEEKRKQVTIGVETRILSNYQRILKAKGGLAMVPIVNSTCGGCHMQLPPQVINEIRLKHEIIYCQMCSRILYDKGE